MLCFFTVCSVGMGVGLLIWQHWYDSFGGVCLAMASAAGCFVLLHLLFALVICVSCLLVDLNRPVKRRSRYFSFLFQRFIPLAFFWAKIRVHVSGLEKLDGQRNFMLVCNHLSIFDPVILAGVLPRHNVSFISKKENYHIPVVRKIMHKIACLPLDREDNRQALRTILQAAQFLKEQDLCMAVFPEGKTSPDGTLQPFRNGAFKVAQRAQRPIVVACLSNTKQIGQNMFRRRTDVQVKILQVIPLAVVNESSTVQLGALAHQAMEQSGV